MEIFKLLNTKERKLKKDKTKQKARRKFQAFTT